MRVRISKNAEQSIILISEYIEIKWSERIRIKFALKIKRCVQIISNDPYCFPKSTYSEILYKCVVSKQTTIYYTIKKNDIVVVSVFDTRQNPNKLK